MSDVLRGICTGCNQEITAEDVWARVSREQEANISFHIHGGQDDWDSKSSGPTKLLAMGSNCCGNPISGMKFKDGDLVVDE